MDYNLFEWGLGAGSAITSSYHADAINNNEDLIVSPQIIAGYIPVNPESKSNLIDLWNSNLGKFNLPNVNNDPILWRYSKSNTTWIPNEIIGIDYSSMLFGLSTLTEYLGIDFFSTYNDFYTSSALSIDQLESTFEIKVYPNPTSDHLYIELGKFCKNISISILNSLGQPVLRNTYDNLEKINIPLKLHKGGELERSPSSAIGNSRKENDNLKELIREHENKLEILIDGVDQPNEEEAYKNGHKSLLISFKNHLKEHKELKYSLFGIIKEIKKKEKQKRLINVE